MDKYGFLLLAMQMLLKSGKRKVKVWFSDTDGKYVVTIKKVKDG